MLPDTVQRWNEKLYSCVYRLYLVACMTWVGMWCCGDLRTVMQGLDTSRRMGQSLRKLRPAIKQALPDGERR